MDNTPTRRQTATQQYAIATATINTMFDRDDELRDTLTAIATTAAGTDPLRAAHDIAEHATRMMQLVDQLTTAVNAAAAYRAKTELAADIGTRPSLLFPRTRTADMTSPAESADTELDGPVVLPAGRSTAA